MMRSAAEQRSNCPMCEARGHTPDHSGHLYTNMTKGVFICFRCGYKGHLNEEERPYVPLRLTNNLITAYRTTREKFMEDAGMAYLPTEPETTEQARALSYLSRRFINPGMVRAWKIMYAVTGRYGGRVVFPCFGESGIEYFTARTINNIIGPKTLHPPKDGTWPGKSEVLWGLDRVETNSPVCVCEGVFDAAVAPGGVALLGKFISMRQIQMIGLRASRVLVMLDGDARAEALDIRDKFRRTFPRLPVSVVDLPVDKDPSDLGPDQVYELVRKYL